MSYRFGDSLRAGSGLSSVLILLANCHQICMTYTIAVCRVKTPDDGQRNCPKHIEFYSKHKFEKFVYLVCFIISIYHDARSPECQNIYRRFSASKIERCSQVDSNPGLYSVSRNSSLSPNTNCCEIVTVFFRPR